MALDVSAIPATDATSSSGIFGNTSTTSTTSASKDKDTFLQLLVAQMRYQDPMNPTDSSQFLSQSAQFTALEKMQDVADKTAQLFQAQISFGASSLIGKTVSWTDPTDKSTKSGAVTGVTFGADGPVLDVGAKDPLPIASVLSVSAGSTSGSTTSA